MVLVVVCRFFNDRDQKMEVQSILAKVAKRSFRPSKAACGHSTRTTWSEAVQRKFEAK